MAASRVFANALNQMIESVIFYGGKRVVQYNGFMICDDHHSTQYQSWLPQAD